MGIFLESLEEGRGAYIAPAYGKRQLDDEFDARQFFAVCPGGAAVGGIGGRVAKPRSDEDAAHLNQLGEIPKAATSTADLDRFTERVGSARR